MCWGMPFSVSPFGSSTFPLFSHLGRILFCQLESRLLPFSFSYFSILVPRDAFCLCHKRLLGFLALVFFALFLIFFSCPFLSSCPNLLLTVFLEGSTPLDGCWGSWLLNLLPWVSFSSMFLRLGFKPPGPFYSFVVPLHLLLWTWLVFPFGPGSLFWASLTVILLDLNMVFARAWYFTLVLDWITLVCYLLHIFSHTLSSLVLYQSYAFMASLNLYPYLVDLSTSLTIFLNHFVVSF